VDNFAKLADLQDLEQSDLKQDSHDYLVISTGNAKHLKSRRLAFC
jgi:hypothetical protein